MAMQEKILIVDDNERNLRILTEILEDEFSIETATGGADAIDKIHDFHPGIVLLDVMMPDIDGLEVCRRIRKDDLLRFIKIILVSGKVRVEERIEGYEAGADDYITKPFDDDELLAKVRVFSKLKALEEVDKLKTDFLSLITHETGTPLNGVIGYSSILLTDNTLSEESREYVVKIRESGEILYEKIERLLLLNHLRRSTLGVKNKLQCSKVVAVVVEELLLKAKKKSLQITIEGDEDNYSLYADSELLKKCLSYILENSIKYSPYNGVITVKHRPTDDKKSYLFEFEDRGPGIDAMKASELFSEFKPIDIAHHAEGLGVSLALVELIAEKHGGEVKVLNNPGMAGCTFTLSLPLER